MCKLKSRALYRTEHPIAREALPGPPGLRRWMSVITKWSGASPIWQTTRDAADIEGIPHRQLLSLSSDFQLPIRCDQDHSTHYARQRQCNGQNDAVNRLNPSPGSSTKRTPHEFIRHGQDSSSDVVHMDVVVFNIVCKRLPHVVDDRQGHALGGPLLLEHIAYFWYADVGNVYAHGPRSSEEGLHELSALFARVVSLDDAASVNDGVNF